MRADDFFTTVDHRQERELAQFPGAAGTGLCASCGKHPPVPGFAMCVACRVAAGLPADAASLAEFRRRLDVEKANHIKAHAKFKARHKETKMTKTPRKTRTCSCGFTTDWGPSLAMHLKFGKTNGCHETTGGGTPMDKQPDHAVPVPNTLRDAEAITEQLTDAVDALRIDPTTSELVDPRIAENVIEPQDFNADEPTPERECVECAEDVANKTLDAYQDLERTTAEFSKVGDVIGVVMSDVSPDVLADAVIAQAKSSRALKAELIDTKLQLIGATLASELSDIDLVTRAALDAHLERVLELVREVAR